MAAVNCASGGGGGGDCELPVKAATICRERATFSEMVKPLKLSLILGIVKSPLSEVMVYDCARCASLLENGRRENNAEGPSRQDFFNLSSRSGAEKFCPRSHTKRHEENREINTRLSCMLRAASWIYHLLSACVELTLTQAATGTIATTHASTARAIRVKADAKGATARATNIIARADKIITCATGVVANALTPVALALILIAFAIGTSADAIAFIAPAIKTDANALAIIALAFIPIASAITASANATKAIPV